MVPWLRRFRARGDDWDFDPQFSPERTRAYIEADFTRDRVYAQANPSCPADRRRCNDAWGFGTNNDIKVSQDARGDLRIDFKFTIALYKPIARALPAINGRIFLDRTSAGSFEASVYADGYPSYEIYQDTPRGTRELYRRSQKSPYALYPPYESSPLLGITPFG
jgi:hypothetical protein